MKTLLTFILSLLCVTAWPQANGYRDLPWINAQNPASGAVPCALTNFLAGYWAFDGNYNDSSGNGETLTQHGSPTFAHGYIFNAINVNVGGAYATRASDAVVSMSGDTSFTWMMWVNQQNAAGLACILEKGNFTSPTPTNEYLFYEDNSGNHYFTFSRGSASFRSDVGAVDAGTPQPFTWYLVVGGYNSTNHTIFIDVNNGTYNTTNWTHGAAGNGANLSIGADSAGYSFAGLMDEVVFWRGRALSQVEIGTIYTNSTRGLTPLNYCSGANGRTTIFFSGDARFSTTGANTNMPTYFSLISNGWASNHDAYVFNCSGGTPPGYCLVEQMSEWTNQIPSILGFYGPGTNLFFVGQQGINNEYIMTGAPLYGYWTGPTIGLQITNYLQRLNTNGVKVIMTTTYPQIGLELDAGDGTLATAEDVRLWANRVTTNFAPNVLGMLDVDLIAPTNHSPMYWGGGNPSEMNDSGNTNIAVHLDALMKVVAP